MYNHHEIEFILILYWTRLEVEVPILQVTQGNILGLEPSMSRFWT